MSRSWCGAACTARGWIVGLDAIHLLRHGGRGTEGAHAHVHDLLDSVTCPNWSEASRIEPDQEDRPLADERRDPSLGAAPALVDDVRIVDDEDVGSPAFHEVAVPERRGGVPVRHDRRVRREDRKDGIHVFWSGPVLAAVAGGPVACPERDHECDCYQPDRGGGDPLADGRAVDPTPEMPALSGPYQPAEETRERPRGRLQGDGKANRENQERHQQVVL